LGLRGKAEKEKVSTVPKHGLQGMGTRKGGVDGGEVEVEAEDEDRHHGYHGLRRKSAQEQDVETEEEAEVY